MGTLFHIFHRVFHTAGGKVCGNCAKVKNTVCISLCRFRQVGLHKFHSRKQNNRELMPQKEGCVMLKGVNKQVVEVVEVILLLQLVLIQHLLLLKMVSRVK